ncbi:MAG: nucleotidyltransferase family protein [Crinalium sp.]
MVVLNKSLVNESAIKQPKKIELLLCCTRTQMSAEYAERIHHLVSHNIDWDELVKIARRHGVLPLLYWQLKDICPEVVPTDVLVQLRNSNFANTKKNLNLTVELLKLLKLFQSNNIPIIPFKGPILAISVYKHLSLREFVDLDILVPEEFVVRTGEILADCGYQPQFNLSDAQKQKYISIGNEQMFRHKDKQVTVDLHWQILPKSFKENTALIWASNEQVNFRGNLLPTLSNDVLLLYLCEHGTKHSWSHLKFICDLAELIRCNPNLNWDGILAQSNKIGNQRMLFLGLYLCQDLLGTVLPENISQQVKSNREVENIAHQVQKQLFSPSQESLNVFHQRNIYLSTLSLKDRLGFYLSTLITPTLIELTMIPLTNWLFPLYYLIRPIRLTLKHGTQKFKSIFFTK